MSLEEPVQETRGRSGRSRKMNKKPGSVRPPSVQSKSYTFWDLDISREDKMELSLVPNPPRAKRKVTGTISNKIRHRPKHRDKRNITIRYRSFSKSYFLLSLSLSRAGFYYVGPGDRVRCFSCGGELDNWEDWDVPLTRHRLSYPNCHYVRELHGATSWILRDEDNRLETYRGHSHHFPNNNQQCLSQAGFYYVGPGDRVRCFSCGGELDNWQPGDEPLTRHQQSYPDCPYVSKWGAKTQAISLSNKHPDTDSNKCLSYGNKSPSLHAKKKRRLRPTVPSSSLTHCDKSDPTAQDTGFSQTIKMESKEQEQSTSARPSGYVMDCELCGKISKTEQVRPKIHGNKYRLELPCKGLFRCSETGIQFRVKSQLAIEYELLSWSDYLETMKQYDIVGPLFNISITSEPGLVSEVYLPHYVCLKGGNVDAMEMKIAHYKDDNMILESPTRVEPYYAVLENPTFSATGAVLLWLLPNIFRRNIPIHGIVQLYYRHIRGYTFHLYLMPQDLSLRKEVEDKETTDHFYRINKPPLACNVYTTNRYTVTGPAAAEINPPDIELRNDRTAVLDNYSEIYLSEVKDGVTLRLILRREREATNETEEFIWEAVLREDDVRQTEQNVCDMEHIVDKHRSQLIRRVSHIDPVLDDLLQDGILTQEQYDTVRQHRISQEKMRKLYEYINSWGNSDKEKFYKSLAEHNGSLIRGIKGPVTSKNNF
ncbi:NACHT, LRR and PYD domains-containing protein 1a-like [Xenopus laevis]|uniref:CARD domain-containing protein n=2 Tax=Xenopus laevis TaxID=8355 RepID=A0AA97PYS9_XENLA|nr:NACHT, LRR and PYD domains-containing protein 1a-like [Xenopus laevis]OCT56671.1 hypothetical protein XELAEV_18004538mg [Xenopus laevis]